VRGKFFLLILLILVAALSFAPVMAEGYLCPPVEICKSLYCMSDKPPYYVGEKYYWWISIEVTAKTDLSSVMVYDRFGAELMIEGISIGTPKYDPYDYDFAYTPYERNGDVYINGALEGNLNKEGVSFDEFHVYWTGKSVKAHFEWSIGAMNSGETRTIYITVSTDTNPHGWQEFTSCGTYYLNSGATVKAIVESTGKQFSAESNGIEIYVCCP